MRFQSLIIGTLLQIPLTAQASSHREAPAIAKDPAADLTDVYVFKSKEQADHYTFVMNVSPAYNSYAGPNWYGFDDEVLYELHIDNTGDAVEDVTYQFRFKTNDYRSQEGKGLIVSYFPHIVYDETAGRYAGLESVLGASGVPALLQTYSVTKVTGGRRSTSTSEIVTGALVAPPRIGPHTTDVGLEFNGLTAKTLAETYTGYKTLADKAIKTSGTSKFFAGPRNDPFYVDLGAVFDRVSPRVYVGTPGSGTAVTGVPRDALKGVNVLSIVFEVPNTEVFGDSGNNHIGVWASTSRPQAKILRTDGKVELTGGGYVQVSRLGNPLVNEVVIKIGDKDKFNYTQPSSDVDNFASYVTDPQLALVLNLLYGTGLASAGITDGVTVPSSVFGRAFIDDIGLTGRQDLVDVFVTGISGVSKHPSASAKGGDMIRVNKALTAGALGITADGDGNAIPAGTSIEGWPLNGRPLEDDVVNTALTFLAECKFLSGLNVVRATKLDLKYDLSGIWSNHDVGLPTGTISATNLAPANCLLNDFVTQPDKTPGSASENGVVSTFPYVDLPHSSYYDRSEVASLSYP
jgi:hypothetical protein